MNPIKPIKEVSPHKSSGEDQHHNSSLASLPGDAGGDFEQLDNLQPIPSSPDKPERNPGWFDKLKKW